jgi:hypothetical protein
MPDQEGPALVPGETWRPRGQGMARKIVGRAANEDGIIMIKFITWARGVRHQRAKLPVLDRAPLCVGRLASSQDPGLIATRVVQRGSRN